MSIGVTIYAVEHPNSKRFGEWWRWHLDYEGESVAGNARASLVEAAEDAAGHLVSLRRRDKLTRQAAARQPGAPAPREPSTQWPLLEVGTLVKASIRDCRFKWLPVANDPGPAGMRERRIQLQERDNVVFEVRRDRVTLMSDDKPISQYDSTFEPASSGEKPPPGIRAIRGRRAFSGDEEGCSQ
jgi:hypothetical protein